VTSVDPSMLAEVHARLQIEDRMHRWTRGADRIDLDLMRSAFHPGASINYGYYIGSVEEFLPWVVTFHTDELTSTAHIIYNMLIEIDGDRASSEAGVDVRLGFNGQNGPSELLVLARYLDRWERRNGQWKIADRTSVVDSYRVASVAQPAEVDPWVKDVTRGVRGPGDPSYAYINGPGDW
jgi:hypothetical protein